MTTSRTHLGIGCFAIETFVFFGTNIQDCTLECDASKDPFGKCVRVSGANTLIRKVKCSLSFPAHRPDGSGDLVECNNVCDEFNLMAIVLKEDICI